MNVTEEQKQQLKDLLAQVLTSEETLALRNDLLCETEWLIGALEGKVNNCVKRMVGPLKSPLVDKTDDELVQWVVSQEGYMNRVEREAANGEGPGFFDPATLSAVGSLAGGIGSIFGGSPKQTIVDDSAVRQQLAAKQQAFQGVEAAKSRSQRAGEFQITAEQQAARDRAEALDRIIANFQSNLRL